MMVNTRLQTIIQRRVRNRGVQGRIGLGIIVVPFLPLQSKVIVCVTVDRRAVKGARQLFARGGFPRHEVRREAGVVNEANLLLKRRN